MTSTIPFMCCSTPSITIATRDDMTTNPAENLFSQHPGLTWRSNGLTSIALVFQLPAATPVDTLGLLFSNLRATDTVRWRAGTSAANTVSAPTYDSGALPAYTGTISSPHRPKSILSLPAPTAGTTQQFWRVDISAPSHPAGYVSAGNVVIGQRLNMGGQFGGMDWGCTFGWMPYANVTTTLGYTSIQNAPNVPTWKITNSWITNTDFMTNYNPFFGIVGNSTPVLFVPDPSSTVIQNEAVYGRLTGPWAASISSIDAWSCDTTITGITC